MTAPADELFTVLYTSTARHPFDGPELDELLEQSRGANERAGITGVLLYRAGRFVQVLEGPREAVMTTLDRIRLDPRHEDVRVMIDEPARERRFADWSMGFERLEAATTPPPAGYRDTFDDLDSVEDPTATLRAARELSLWFRVRAAAP